MECSREAGAPPGPVQGCTNHTALQTPALTDMQRSCCGAAAGSACVSLGEQLRDLALFWLTATKERGRSKDSFRLTCWVNASSSICVIIRTRCNLLEMEKL